MTQPPKLIEEYTRVLKRITDSFEFKKIHDKFKLKPSLKNYIKLIILLRSENRRFDRILEKSVTLLTDSRGSVIFNSRLKDDLDDRDIKDTNSFGNYNRGRIVFNDVHQCQASTIADKMGSSQIAYNKETENKSYGILYVSIRVGSTYTAGKKSMVNKNLCPDGKCAFAGQCAAC